MFIQPLMHMKAKNIKTTIRWHSNLKLCRIMNLRKLHLVQIFNPRIVPLKQTTDEFEVTELSEDVEDLESQLEHNVASLFLKMS
ncbi:unnamed protein product [Boreogadus saida]